ncbi:hypothetical protein THAOC_29175 [Thalassiosira oceanica]|uniref:Uncharacterized protein n=1 Tax=Thalassiosira oceanica TaxID=159749 RepID=K0RH79_THAOC|nr:hypothetical protein THAOC_29175 [Thalassiosira oceanica]|eukprot:EJK51634.1 hypothetical protein THAOC_29175 [Thalassiosira oceanica]
MKLVDLLAAAEVPHLCPPRQLARRTLLGCCWISLLMPVGRVLPVWTVWVVVLQTRGPSPPEKSKGLPTVSDKVKEDSVLLITPHFRLREKG